MSDDVAVLFGVIVMTFLAAAMVVAAFLRPTVRFVRSRIERHQPTFPDRLCAGIWLSALGAMAISAVSLARIILDQPLILTGFAVVAWLGIASGYFLHFTAWRASFVGRETGFALRYAGGLVILSGAATWLAVILIG